MFAKKKTMVVFRKNCLFVCLFFNILCYILVLHDQEEFLHVNILQ